MDGVDQKARDTISAIGARIDAHEQVCAEIQRSNQQWRENATRILEDMQRAQARTEMKVDRLVETVASGKGGVRVLLWIGSALLAATASVAAIFQIPHH